ncbi:peptidylprolyl isomerase [Actinospica robiniae]|uniref:peptidylprolyl isomerase n=1 Tax=Actinospica robiniae TaxID=304901 RepID=UPI0009FDBF7B|nr:peptidylprolyl isomerase [Actinospica robiniae]
MNSGDPQDGGPQDAVPARWGQPQQPYPQQPSRRSPKTVLITVVTFAVIGGLALGAFFLGQLVRHDPHPSAVGRAALPPVSASRAPAPCVAAASITAEPTGYEACGTAARNVGIPDYDAAAAKRAYTITIKTNRGDIEFTADGKAAPYTVYSFVYLVNKQYFTTTPCHRLTTAGIYVLQCGDPSGTGSGGPGYQFQDENLASLGTPDATGAVTYKAGTVAMANAGPGTNGSQFFLVYKDSPIPPAYTPFGTITEGLDVLQQIAQAGTDDSNSAGDGVPKESVQIESVTVR